MRIIRIFWISLLFTPSIVFGQAVGDKAALESEHQVATAAMNKALAANGTDTGLASTSGSITSALSAEKAAIGACQTKMQATYAACAEWLSPEIASFVSEYGAIIQGASMAVGSMVDQCKGISDMLNKGNLVLGAYQIACATAQGLCKSSCAGVGKAAGAVEAAVPAAIAEAAGLAGLNAAHAQYSPIAANAATRKADSAVAVKYCTRYQISTASAIMGGVAALKGVMTAKNCEDQKSATTATLDCTNQQSPMYNSKNCKCGRGELTMAECQNINISANSIKSPQVSAGKVGTGGETSGTVPSTDGDFGGGPGGEAPSNSGMAGAPIGGGGGQMGGGAGGNGGGAQDGSTNPRRLNANVLGGFGGGGGGGGGAGPGYGDTDSKLKPYAPGGEKDPSRSVASQLAKEVTAQAGRSNWEKVKTRYRDNIRTLMSK